MCRLTALGAALDLRERESESCIRDTTEAGQRRDQLDVYGPRAYGHVSAPCRKAPVGVDALVEGPCWRTT
jgi:hypothetical protein